MIIVRTRSLIFMFSLLYRSKARTLSQLTFPGKRPLAKPRGEQRYDAEVKFLVGCQGSLLRVNNPGTG